VRKKFVSVSRRISAIAQTHSRVYFIPAFSYCVSRGKISDEL